MKFLIISHFFPPYNTIGSIRVGKTAKYLMRMGHEVRVISAEEQPFETTLALEIPCENVVYTKWMDVNALPRFVCGGRKRVAAKGYSGKWSSSVLVKKIAGAYRACTNFPDGQIGWYHPAVDAAMKLCRTWRPDVILASARPYTSLLIGSAVSRKLGIPWVADLRDLWVDDQYYEYSGLRHFFEAKLEKSALESASGLITVSEPLGNILNRKYTVPVRVIPNGFDDEEFLPLTAVKPADGLPLVISYTGIIQEGKRTPEALFQALANLGPDRRDVRVQFYGRYMDCVERMAQRYGIEDTVTISPMVPYDQSLRIQRTSDVLLLLLWNDAREKGVFTGKVFEYLAAKRPILVIGHPDAAACRLVQEKNAGFIVQSAGQIEELLRGWICEKRNSKIIPENQADLTGWSRREHVETLVAFVQEIIPSNIGRSR